MKELLQRSGIVFRGAWLFVRNCPLAPCWELSGRSLLACRGGKPSLNMLAEAFEAVLGAMYLDGSFEAAQLFYERHFPLPTALTKMLLATDDTVRQVRTVVVAKHCASGTRVRCAVLAKRCTRCAWMRGVSKVAVRLAEACL